ncbi:VOC family protein [uncultured Limosilactobacillus sp.]|uniref:VOC family protein n=1 Tax=uncultured Limosilactobacillus sp. TaxID=2837629 RepID=UPI0025E55291|nr:VOC family protein [uncultured Limosilactobacillus sp.]
MAADIYPFLTFENSKEAMDYYVHEFGAEIIERTPFTEEQVQTLGLNVADLSTTTARGQFEVAGHRILCGDATMTMPQASSLVSLFLDFGGDVAAAKELFDRLAASDQQRVTLPFADHLVGRQLGQIVDKYGVTWYISGGDKNPV